MMTAAFKPFELPNFGKQEIIDFEPLNIKRQIVAKTDKDAQRIKTRIVVDQEAAKILHDQLAWHLQQANQVIARLSELYTKQAEFKQHDFSKSTDPISEAYRVGLLEDKLLQDIEQEDQKFIQTQTLISKTFDLLLELQGQVFFLENDPHTDWKQQSDKLRATNSKAEKWARTSSQDFGQNIRTLASLLAKAQAGLQTLKQTNERYRFGLFMLKDETSKQRRTGEYEKEIQSQIADFDELLKQAENILKG